MSIIENIVTLDASPDEVFALITEPARLRRWMAVSARIDLHAGGDYRFLMAPGSAAVGEVKEIVPGKLLSIAWNWDFASADAAVPAGTVSIEIEPVTNGTQVTLRHEGLPDDQIAGHTDGWNHFMGRLGTAVTDGDAGWDEWTSGPKEGMDLYLAAEVGLAAILPLMRHFTADDRNRETPCSEFTLNQLVEHLVGSLTYMAAARGADVSGLLPDTSDPEARIAEVGDLAILQYRKAGLDGTIKLGEHDVPADVGLKIIGLELLVHAWDIARTIDAELTIAPQVTDYVTPLYSELISAQQPGDAFAAATQTTGQASGIDLLAAATGRPL
jgi:uncharacterized protein (TIGR03086 family)